MDRNSGRMPSTRSSLVSIGSSWMPSSSSLTLAMW